MDALPCPPYPQYAWLAHWIAVHPPRVFDVHECRHVTHHVMLTVTGAAEVHWSTRAGGRPFHAAAGNLGFFPCDREVHTLAITAAEAFVMYDLLSPEQHIRRICASEGMQPGAEMVAFPAFRDALVQACLLRLARRPEAHAADGIGDEIAARQVVVRLCEVAGARRPEWHRDTSVFAPLVMRRLVDLIDGQLAAHPSLESIADTVGLSPGHFARKFQQSAGLSLGRFMNGRRIGMSFAMLKAGAIPLSQIALDLGFSSQSHFTRLFSGHTGMAPQQFRRQHVQKNG